MQYKSASLDGHQDRARAEDVRCAYSTILGRSVESQEAVEAKLNLSIPELLVVLLSSEEFNDRIGLPLVAGEPVLDVRFLERPSVTERSWVAQRAPLTETGRREMLREMDWADVHRVIFSDALFQQAISGAPNSALLAQLGKVLSSRRTPPGTTGPGHIKRPGKSSDLDARARALVLGLDEARREALFDRDFIHRTSGRSYFTVDEAIEAYFAMPVNARVDPTPGFDPAFYRSCVPDWELGGGDPFAHFITEAADGSPQPHPLMKLADMALRHGADVSALDVFCDLLIGEEVGQFHPLVDMEFIRSQPGHADKSAREIFVAVADRETELAFAPHPLFDPAYYRRHTIDVLGNELLHYLRSGRGAARTHPLVSPEYLHAQIGPPASGVSLLEAYLACWPNTLKPPCLFVETAHLNHAIHLRYPHVEGEPLSALIRLGLDGEFWLHPEVDRSFLKAAFHNRTAAADTLSLLKAALETPSVAAAERPWLSVVIVSYHKPGYTALAVLAALNALQGVSHEIIIVENAGDILHHEELLRMFSTYPSVRFVKLPQNRYFGEGNNIGVDLASGEWILFLNNDCFLHPDYGAELKSFCAEKGVDVVGTTMFFPNGKIQEFGGVIQDDGQVIQSMKNLDPSYLQAAVQVRQVDYASAACLAISRRALDVVAGFDPLFEPLYYEDTDLCRRLKQAGFKVMVTQKLRATHVENGTTREFLGAKFDDQIARNRDLFARRWLKHGGRDTYVRRRVTPSKERATALVYSPFDIRTGGGERYLLAAARALSRRHRVVLATPERISEARLEFVCHALGVEPFAVELRRLSDATSHNPRFDVTFVMGNEISPSLGPLGDINLYHLQFPFPWRHVRGFEFSRLGGFDAVVVNSEYTAGWTATRLREAGVGAGSPPIHVVNPPVRPFEWAAAAPMAGRPVRLCNVGRFFRHGHSKRQDVFLDVVEALRARGVSVEATLIGSVVDSADSKAYFAEIRARAQALNVNLLLDASREEVGAALQTCDIYLHCCGFQVDESLGPEQLEHFGIAVVEAMTAGAVPVVVDRGGPAEIVRRAGVGATFGTVAEAVNQIMACIRQPTRVPPGLDGVFQLSDEAFADRLEQVIGAVRAGRAASPSPVVDAVGVLANARSF